MLSTLAHVVDFVLTEPWAVTRPTLTTIATVITRHLSGRKLTAEDLAAIQTMRRPQAPPRVGSVAIIPVHGVLMPRANMMSDLSGATSYDELTGQVREAIADPHVGTVLLDVDSPGGNCAGLPEFCQVLRESRVRKPIVAQANYQMASAAYAIAAGATEIVASPSAVVGSIGVYTIHEDLSKMLQQEGIAVTLISAGKYKTEGNEFEPLSDEARAQIQSRVDTTYARMVQGIGLGRGIPADDVIKGYGQGRCVDATTALELGMVDRMATFDETLARFGARRDPPQELQATGLDHAYARAYERELYELLL